MITIAFDDAGKLIGAVPFRYPEEQEDTEYLFEIKRKALQFYERLVMSSRTLSAVKVRIVASKVILGDLSVKEGASSLGITERQLYREVKALKKVQGLR